MRCFSCGAENMEKGLATYFEEFGECKLIVENVPCYRCAQCGEEMIPGNVAARLDEIIEKMKETASSLIITQYSDAA